MSATIIPFRTPDAEYRAARLKQFAEHDARRFPTPAERRPVSTLQLDPKAARDSMKNRKPQWDDLPPAA